MSGEKNNEVSKYLVWMDLEMTGLNPDQDEIIEIAVIITNNNLEVVAEGPCIAIHQPKSRFDLMDDWNRNQHTHTGLWQKVLESPYSTNQAETEALDFVRKWVPEGLSPLCGNSIWQDRRFLAKYMPKLEAYLHYRMIDVSTLKELSRRWFPEIQKKVKKDDAHRALSDILQSIEELKIYRENMLIQHGENT